MELLDRIKEPTPIFWKKVKKIAISLGIVGGVILGAPITLPAGIITAAGYLVVAGSVAAGLAQTTSTRR